MFLILRVSPGFIPDRKFIEPSKGKNKKIAKEKLEEDTLNDRLSGINSLLFSNLGGIISQTNLDKPSMAVSKTQLKKCKKK